MGSEASSDALKLSNHGVLVQAENRAFLAYYTTTRELIAVFHGQALQGKGTLKSVICLFTPAPAIGELDGHAEEETDAFESAASVYGKIQKTDYAVSQEKMPRPPMGWVRLPIHQAKLIGSERSRLALADTLDNTTRCSTRAKRRRRDRSASPKRTRDDDAKRARSRSPVSLSVAR